MRLVLLGPPGSGKGTQAVMFCKAHGLQHVSTGDMLRDEVARRTSLGLKAEAFMKKGELVPDALVVEMIASRLKTDFLLDGFPRSLGQAEALDEVLNRRKLSLDAVLNLIVRDETIVTRLSKRLVCKACKSVFTEGVVKCDKCGGKLSRRPDDNPGTIRERLRVYREKTKPLENYYANKGLLKNVDGEGSAGEVCARLKRVLS